MTQRRFIKIIFQSYSPTQSFTCAELTARVAAHFGITSKYLSGSISSALARMVVQEELEIAPEVGPRGGKMYRKGKNFII